VSIVTSKRKQEMVKSASYASAGWCDTLPTGFNAGEVGPCSDCWVQKKTYPILLPLGQEQFEQTEESGELLIAKSQVITFLNANANLPTKKWS
jgi:hypothetical protein